MRCSAPPLPRRDDGAMTAADAEGALRKLLIALDACDARRALLIESWPKGAQ